MHGGYCFNFTGAQLRNNSHFLISGGNWIFGKKEKYPECGDYKGGGGGRCDIGSSFQWDSDFLDGGEYNFWYDILRRGAKIFQRKIISIHSLLYIIVLTKS